jgi:RNA polymerase sigma-70 factor (ECF subfamily)
MMDEIVRLIAAEIPRLRRYARSLLHDQDRADDLVQDTLLRGLDKVRLFRSGDVRAWLFTIMHNQYVNSVRGSVKRGETIVVEKVHIASPASQLPNLELRELESAVARLTVEQRTTLLLVTLEGMKYEEAAKICDVPVGTVRSRLNRAREELRRMMQGTVARRGSHLASRGESTSFKVEPVKGGETA